MRLTSALPALALSLYFTMVMSAGDPTFSYFTETSSGDGTYYGQYSQGGTCTLDPTPESGSNSQIFASVAVNAIDFRDSQICGACLRVVASGQGSGSNPIIGNLTVFANNKCPECRKGDLDFGLSGDGRWAISWTVIPCPINTKVQYFYQGSNDYYIKIQARNLVIPINNFYVQQNGNFIALQRTPDNFFTSSGSISFPLAYPITVRLESVLGENITDTISAYSNGQPIQGNAQFASVTPATSSSITTGNSNSNTNSGSGSNTGSNSGSHSPSSGAVAGAVIGVILGVALIVTVVFVIYKKTDLLDRFKPMKKQSVGSPSPGTKTVSAGV